MATNIKKFVHHSYDEHQIKKIVSKNYKRYDKETSVVKEKQMTPEECTGHLEEYEDKLKHIGNNIVKLQVQNPDKITPELEKALFEKKLHEDLIQLVEAK